LKEKKCWNLFENVSFVFRYTKSRRHQPITWCRLWWWHSYLGLHTWPIAMGQYADQLHIQCAFHSGTAAELHKSLSSNDKSKLVINKWIKMICLSIFIFLRINIKLIAMNSNTNNTPKGYSCTTFFFLMPRSFVNSGTLDRITYFNQ